MQQVRFRTKGGSPIARFIRFLAIFMILSTSITAQNAPSFSLPAYQPHSNGGVNPFADRGYHIDGQRECTWYAWGRAYEKLGVAIVFKQNGIILNQDRDARRWLDITPDLEHGTTPRANSIIVWQSPGTPGHIAFLESITGNNAVITEANRDSRGHYDGETTIPLSELQVGVVRRQLGSTYQLAGFVYLGATNRSLIKRDSGDPTVYWLQNNKRFGIPTLEIITSAMSGMTRWSSNSISQMPASTVNAITEGPVFIKAGNASDRNQSDGLLIRVLNTDSVYLIENGARRWIKSQEALDWINGGSNFPNVIDVTNAILSGYVPNQGKDVYGVGEGETDSTVKNAFINKYKQNAANSYCVSSSTWKGWPGNFSECLRFPVDTVKTAPASGVSGVAGKFQNFGNDSTIYGTIEYSVKGTFAVWGAIFNKWRDLGYSGSTLGFPTSDEYSVGSNRRSDFEGGSITWDRSRSEATVTYNSGGSTITDRDITVLANSVQDVAWFYVYNSANDAWYIVHPTNTEVLLLHRVDRSISGGLGWKPINNTSFQNYVAAGRNFTSVTIASNGRSISFGSLTATAPSDRDVTLLANNTFEVLWFYIYSASNDAWYIVHPTSTAVMLLHRIDTSVQGNIGWKPINHSSFQNYPSAGDNYSSVTISSDGRRITFGALR